MSKLLKVENIKFKYKEKEILKNISFDLDRGVYLSLIGVNGSGKTTLFNIIAGLLEPNEGELKFQEKPLKDISFAQRALDIALISQREKLQFPYTALEIVLMGKSPRKGRFERINDNDLQEAKTLMQITKTWQFASKKITELSGGEEQRILLTRALLQKPKLLLLDESMSELDINARYFMSKILKEMIIKTNMSVLSINHDLSLAYKFSDQIMVLNNKKIEQIGNNKQIFNQQLFENIFNVKAKIYENGFMIDECI